MCERLKKQLDRIRKAYDLAAEQYKKRIDPIDSVPEEFRNSQDFKVFMKETGPSLTGSSAPDIKEYLNPKTNMRFLDVGCCGNLATYRLDKWPSTYYGVDISTALVRAMKDFVARKRVTIGGLWVADLSDLPFDDDFFDIAAVIGVLEYYPIEYVKRAFSELHRVLKSQARVVLDIPNKEHKYIYVMVRLESYLGRPSIIHERSAFEKILKKQFFIERRDDSRVMLKYFIKTIK